ncbi:MAG: DUF4358 domain-containing protein [Bacilli bacterium]|nr:DUF4358 domain-containing protein [Bacilli bacterium]
MKKFLTVLMVAMLMFVTGCGNNDISELNVDETKKIIEQDLKDMKDVSEDSLEDVYGLNLDLMEVHVIKENTSGDLYAIIKTTDKNQTKKDMENYFEKVKTFNANYSPERLQILEDRVEKEIGDYLIYIVAENADEIYENIINNL